MTTLREDSPRPDDHLTETVLAEYIDRRLTSAERDRAESHLAACPACRTEMLGARQFVRRRTQTRRLIAAGGLIAVAATLLLMVRTDQEPVIMRAGSSMAALVAYGPSGEVAASPLRFTWSAAQRASTYRFTLSGESGSSVWSSGTADTSLVLPASVTLRSGQRYFWVADAILSDGATLSTGLREFRVAP
jgi:anti-sigma factor RsiW